MSRDHVAFRNRPAPAPLMDVARVERALGTRLPEPYRRFLLEVNGGTPLPAHVSIARLGEGCVRVLYGVHDDPFHGLEEQVRDYEPLLPDDVIPIGDDALGNLVCLGIRSEPRGKVYFWVDGEHPQDEPSYANMYLLASDFDQFLASLRDSPRRPTRAASSRLAGNLFDRAMDLSVASTTR